MLSKLKAELRAHVFEAVQQQGGGGAAQLLHSELDTQLESARLVTLPLSSHKVMEKLLLQSLLFQIQLVPRYRKGATFRRRGARSATCPRGSSSPGSSSSTSSGEQSRERTPFHLS